MTRISQLRKRTIVNLLLALLHAMKEGDEKKMLGRDFSVIIGTKHHDKAYNNKFQAYADLRGRNIMLSITQDGVGVRRREKAARPEHNNRTRDEPEA